MITDDFQRELRSVYVSIDLWVDCICENTSCGSTSKWIIFSSFLVLLIFVSVSQSVYHTPIFLFLRERSIREIILLCFSNGSLGSCYEFFCLGGLPPPFSSVGGYHTLSYLRWYFSADHGWSYFSISEFTSVKHALVTVSLSDVFLSHGGNCGLIMIGIC